MGADTNIKVFKMINNKNNLIKHIIMVLIRKGLADIEIYCSIRLGRKYILCVHTLIFFASMYLNLGY